MHALTITLNPGVTTFAIAGGILALLYLAYYLVFNIDWKRAPDEEEETIAQNEQLTQRRSSGNVLGGLPRELDQMMHQMMSQAEEHRREQHRGEKIILEITISDNPSITTKKGNLMGVKALKVNPHFADGSSAMQEFSELSEEEREKMILKELENMEAYEVLAMFRDAKDSGIQDLSSLL